VAWREGGWRGWALPRLLQNHSAWAASLMLAAAWIVWRLPAFAMGGVMRATLTDLPWWALATLGLTLPMTALHRRANGNLVVAGVLPHAVINALGAADQCTSRPIQALLLLASGAFLLPARRPPECLARDVDVGRALIEIKSASRVGRSMAGHERPYSLRTSRRR